MLQAEGSAARSSRASSDVEGNEVAANQEEGAGGEGDGAAQVRLGKATETISSQGVVATGSLRGSPDQVKEINKKV